MKSSSFSRSSKSISPVQSTPFSQRNPPKRHNCANHAHPSTIISFKDQIVKLKADKTNLTLENSKLRREINHIRSASELGEDNSQILTNDEAQNSYYEDPSYRKTKSQKYEKISRNVNTIDILDGRKGPGFHPLESKRRKTHTPPSPPSPITPTSYTHTKTPTRKAGKVMQTLEPIENAPQPPQPTVRDASHLSRSDMSRKTPKRFSQNTLSTSPDPPTHRNTHYTLVNAQLPNAYEETQYASHYYPLANPPPQSTPSHSTFDHLPPKDAYEKEVRNFKNDFNNYKNERRTHEKQKPKRDTTSRRQQSPIKSRADQKNVESLKSLIDRQDRQIIDLRLQLQKAEQSSETLTQKFAEETSFRPAADTEVLHKRISDLQRRLRAAESQKIEDSELLQSAHLKISNLENELKLQQKLSSALEEEVKGYRDKRDEGARLATDRGIELSTVKRANEMLKKEITELRTELILLKTDNTAGSKQTLVAAEEQRAKALELLAFARENESLRGDVGKLEAELFRLEHSLPHYIRS